MRLSEFGDDLIGKIKRTIAQRLPSGYVVRMLDRAYLKFVDPHAGQVRERHFEPHVSLQQRRQDIPLASNPTKSSDAAVFDAFPGSVEVSPLLEIENREIYLDIIDAKMPRNLITSIEVFSPSNKRPGSLGWEQYERKRDWHLAGRANLVEIDLLARRQASRPLWARATVPLPYYILVCRASSAPQLRAWPAGAFAPLPSIPVRLRGGDSDISLDLQPLVNAICERSRYYLDIDYALPLSPPLTPEEMAYLPHVRLPRERPKSLWPCCLA